MRQFYNTRAKLARIEDESLFYGWVVSGVPNKLFVRFDGETAFAMGTRFRVNLLAKNAATEFESFYEGMNNGRAVFSLPPLVRIDQPNEAARVKTLSVKAMITSTPEPTEVLVVDISVRGIGIVTGESYDNDTEVKMTIKAPNGEIEVAGKVIYSRFEQESDGFRTGIEIRELGRIDEARWNQLLAS